MIWLPELFGLLAQPARQIAASRSSGQINRCLCFLCMSFPFKICSPPANHIRIREKIAKVKEQLLIDGKINSMNDFKFSKREKVYLLLALAVLAMLFVSSSMTYHEQKMKPGFIHTYLGWLEDWIQRLNIYYDGVWHNVKTDGSAGFTQFVVRKTAHFGSYFLYGLFAYLGLRRVFVISWTGPFFVWATAFAFAAMDEFHQFLTGDRTPTVHDVMLDASGACLAIVLAVIYYLLKGRAERKKSAI